MAHRTTSRGRIRGGMGYGGALAAAAIAICPAWAAASDDKPALQDFIGINGHSVVFQPTLYSPTTSLVRDYHNMNWDVGNSTANNTTFPIAANGVNWNTEYGSWVNQGFRIDASLQLQNLNWNSYAADSYKYGKAVAQYFGSNGNNLVASAEVGNEPGQYSDSTYRTILTNMAAGLRDGDPNMTILSGNVTAGSSGTYAKSLDSLLPEVTAQNGTTMRAIDRVDALSVHTYAYKNGAAGLYPTWERTYPEDSNTHFLSSVQDVINWRNTNAPGKQVWVTEFGWDSTTKPNYTTGDFKDWNGNVTDTQQAQYLTRSYLLFSGMDVDRAYMYYFNDDDEPQMHGSSGLTRNFVPKPSYYAISQMQSVLGDYHFDQIIKHEADNLYIYSYQSESDPTQSIWAIWSPTGSGREVLMDLAGLPGTPLSAEGMALAAGAAPLVPFTVLSPDSIRLMVGESPIYLHMSVPVPEPSMAWPVLALAAIALPRRRRESDRGIWSGQYPTPLVNRI